jgi:inositol transport system substrate-binding protein
MKRIFGITVPLLVLAVLLVSYGTPSITSAAGKKTFKVAYVARAQADSFAAWLANAIKAETKKYPKIKLSIFDGQGSDDKQNSMIENAIAARYDLIIIQPNNGEPQRPYAEKALKAGIFVITTNARIQNIPGSSSVDANPYEQGAVNARLGLKQIPKNAKVVVLNGPAGSFHSIERRKAWKQEFFDKRPDVKIVGEQIANWNKDEAMKYMEDWVQANNKIDAVISMNDNMCAGALEVVKNNPKYKGLLAYGVDGTMEACQLIKEGRMTSTSLQNAFELAEKVMSISNKLLTHKIKQIDTDVGNPLITKANAAQYIKLLKRVELTK